VATLDLHAHVTADMVRFANALIAWETYPHRDAFSTGVRGARMLLGTLQGRHRPTIAVAKVPVITGAVRGSTEGDDPFADLMRAAKAHEGRDRVLSTSVFLVHPFLDQPDMGSGALVITDGDADGAVRLARGLAEQYWSRRFDLEPEVLSPREAIVRGLKAEGGPVLLVETADCCGGGAAGDSVSTLKALLDAGVTLPSLVPVVDPDAAAACHRAGPGREVTVSLGHRLDPRWGQPVTVTGRVARLSDGRFRYAGGIWDGVEGNMGPSAVLSIGAIQALVASHGTYDWADEQFRAVDLSPPDARFIVVKNPMNYRMAYGPIARAAFILDTPGPTPATVRGVRYRHLQRPYFPLDRDIPGLTPTILRG
jgi:microcystin degradation protein MlrC